MRIVAGRHRGRILSSPPGRDTRPTSDRARESLFNVLAHAGWLEADAVDGAGVLDVFAGTGALGLEALSRGAAHAVFMENDREALAACRKNIAQMKEDARAAVLPCDALKPPPPGNFTPCSLVFLDPPYGFGHGERALLALRAAGWLAPGAVVVMEMSKKKPEALPRGFIQRDSRVYGLARVDFLVMERP